METITFPTYTYAQKALRELRKKNIYARIIKVDSSKTRLGCAYGIEYDGNFAYDVAIALRNAEIPYENYPYKEINH